MCQTDLCSRFREITYLVQPVPANNMGVFGIYTGASERVKKLTFAPEMVLVTKRRMPLQHPPSMSGVGSGLLLRNRGSFNAARNHIDPRRVGTDKKRPLVLRIESEGPNAQA